jgi:hypothetical protein
MKCERREQVISKEKTNILCLWQEAFYGIQHHILIDQKQMLIIGEAILGVK